MLKPISARLLLSLLFISFLAVSACSDSGSSSDNNSDPSGENGGDGMDTGDGMDGGEGGDPTDGSGDDQCGGFDDTAAVDEAASGDLSNDRLQPTVVRLAPGANSIKATTGVPDTLDYFSLVVGPCDTLDSMFIGSFAGTLGDETAFFAIQQGESFTVDPLDAQTSIADMMGYSHFGSLFLDQDLLAIASTAAGASGFTTPLASGTYTIWVQQIGPVSDYELLFNVSRVSGN